MMRVSWRRVPASLLVLAAGAAVAGEKFEAALSGANEVPPVATATTGKAEIELSDDGARATFELEVRGGERITQAHIHCARAGVNGPNVVFLAGFHNLGWDVDGSWVENAAVTDANVLPTSGTGPCPEVITDLSSLARAIRNGNAYVNVHSVAFPGGVIRGQLRD